jgi:hypothetical protein
MLVEFFFIYFLASRRGALAGTGVMSRTNTVSVQRVLKGEILYERQTKFMRKILYRQDEIRKISKPIYIVVQIWSI